MVTRRADRKRILVFSASFGGPHESVAQALVCYFKDHHAASVDVRQVDFLEQFMPNVNVLAKFGYQQSLLFFPRLRGDITAAISKEPGNPVVHEFVTGAMEGIGAFLEGYRPDVVVSVLPVAAAAASEVAVEQGFVSVAVLTDFTARDAWLHPSTDGYFVASRETSDELVVGDVKWDRITVSGIPVPGRQVAEGTQAQRRKQLGLADRFTCALMASAGSPAEVLSIAERAAESGMQVSVPVGGSPRLRHAIAELAASSSLVKSFGREAADSDLMATADIVVSPAGGRTAATALSLGAPLILYNPIPGQERHNVDFLVNFGAALLARDEEDTVEKLRFLSTHPERLRQMAVDSAALGRPDATRTVCERVLAFPGRGAG